MLLSEKSSAFITVNVPTIDVGMASAAISVTRVLRMNRNTTNAASRPPITRWSWISSNDLRMNRDWSRIGVTLMSAGSPAWTRSSRASTRSTTATVLVPDCLRIISDTAVSPSRRVWLRTSSIESVTRATSSIFTAEPSLYDSTIRLKSSTDRSRPIVRIDTSVGPAVKLPPAPRRSAASPPS
jgi:hypothetical protein